MCNCGKTCRDNEGCKPLTFVVGKKYVQRDGNVVECVAVDMRNSNFPGGPLVIRLDRAGASFRRADGRYSKADHPADLVAEYKEPLVTYFNVYGADGGILRMGGSHGSYEAARAAWLGVRIAGTLKILHDEEGNILSSEFIKE